MLSSTDTIVLFSTLPTCILKMTLAFHNLFVLPCNSIHNYQERPDHLQRKANYDWTKKEIPMPSLVLICWPEQLKNHHDIRGEKSKGHKVSTRKGSRASRQESNSSGCSCLLAILFSALMLHLLVTGGSKVLLVLSEMQTALQTVGERDKGSISLPS